MKEKTQRSLREEAIIKIYETYMKRINHKEHNYHAYQFVQLLIGMTDEEFSREFRVNDEGRVEKLVEFIEENEIRTCDELCLKVVVAKNVEQSQIDLEFSDDFRLKDVGDEIIVEMLENVENRI